MAKAAGEEENCCTCAGLLLVRERIALLDGLSGIILVAMIKEWKPVANWRCPCRNERRESGGNYDSQFAWEQEREKCRPPKIGRLRF
jgi:hypothetical protein